jgi:8-oxo-dGTP pyrophosphatase MutT (NUDIX family)
VKVFTRGDENRREARVTTTVSRQPTYPALFDERSWGPVRARFEVNLVPPADDDLVASVHAVPFVGDDCVVVRLADGTWEWPGGTREPSEAWRHALVRELYEETGARILDYQPFGWYRCVSSAATVLAGWAQVELAGRPTVDIDLAEEVVQVACVSVETAGSLLEGCGRPELADLYRFAADIRGRSCARPSPRPQPSTRCSAAA